MTTVANFKLWAVLLAAIAAALMVALLTVIAAQVASAHANHEPSAGWFQRCSLAKSAAFDPIVFPDEPPPVRHRHLFFGSTAISYDSSVSDLRAGGTTFRFEDGTNGGNTSTAGHPLRG